MVTQYGMSESLGLRVYGERQEMVFLGREISEQRDYSDAIAEKIDAEVNEIINTVQDGSVYTYFGVLLTLSSVGLCWSLGRKIMNSVFVGLGTRLLLWK